MKLKKIDWAANTMLLTGVVGILYFTRMLHWHEKSFLCFFVSFIIYGLSFYAKDPASQKQIRVIHKLFILIAALFIVLHELFF